MVYLLKCEIVQGLARQNLAYGDFYRTGSYAITGIHYVRFHRCKTPGAFP